MVRLMVSNIMYQKIKKVKFLKDTERNNKGFEYFGMYNYKT